MMTYRHFNDETTRSSIIRAVSDTANEAAWQRLFDLYAGFVFSLARKKGLKAADANDIVQVVFLDLARNLPTFRYDRTKGKFRSYLTGLVYWRVNDKLKAGQRDKELKAEFWEELKTASVNDSFAERAWRQAAMEEALRRIKSEVRPDHYAAFVASAVEGQDTEQSWSSTVSLATISIRSASGSPGSFARRWIKSLAKWTRPMRPILGLDGVGHH